MVNPLKNQYNSNFPSMILTTYLRFRGDQARKQDSHLWRYNNSPQGGAIVSSYFT